MLRKQVEEVEGLRELTGKRVFRAEIRGIFLSKPKNSGD